MIALAYAARWLVALIHLAARGAPRVSDLGSGHRVVVCECGSAVVMPVGRVESEAHPGVALPWAIGLVKPRLCPTVAALRELRDPVASGQDSQ